MSINNIDNNYNSYIQPSKETGNAVEVEEEITFQENSKTEYTNSQKEEDVKECLELFDDNNNKEIGLLEKVQNKFKEIIGSIKDYFDGDTKDGQIGNTKQGNAGDCWLLTAVNALSYSEKGRQIIKDSIEINGDNTTVHLAVGDYTVTKQDIAIAKAEKNYSTGDDDMLILELAIEKHLEKYPQGALHYSDDAPWYLTREIEHRDDKNKLEGGWSANALYYITGKNTQVVTDSDEREKVLNDFIKNGNSENVLTSGIMGLCHVYNTDGEYIELYGPHAYAVKQADENTVTVVNPWDSSKEIKLSKDTFLEAFLVMYSTDISDNNPTVNYLRD